MKTLKVCQYCLEAITSRGENQHTITHYIDDDEDIVCDWCGEWDDALYEILEA